MSVINYGIIGCGMMGQEHIGNIGFLPDARVAAVFEPDAGMRAIAAKLAPEAKLCVTIDEFLKVPALDCIVIVSPNHCHMGQVTEIAATRPLPLLVEKPLSVTFDDLPEVKRLKASYPAPIWVAMEYRYMPPVAKLIEEAEAVTGGVKMLTIREHRFPFLEKVGDWNRFNRNTGGTLVEKCCHFFDLMRHIFKADPIRVMASGGQITNHMDEKYNNETPDIWDSAYVIADFPDGRRSMLELCMFADGSEYQEEISAVGPNGKIECFVPGPGRFWPSDRPAPMPKVVISPRAPKGPQKLDIPVDPRLLEAGDHNGSTFYQHEKFRAVIHGEQDPEVTLNDGWMAVAMGLAAQRSAETGTSVELADFI